MSRKKLQRFDAMKSMPHLYEAGFDSDPTPHRGQWGAVFENEYPITLELACGRGDYTLGLARRFPERNFMGMDIKGSRLWFGCQRVLEENLNNVRFLRGKIEDLNRYVGPGELAEIWITFPDPHPRKGKVKKRLTSPRFLAMYRQLLAPGGVLHLKTDHLGFFDYSEATLQEEGWRLEEVIRDLYASDCDNPILTEIQTTYEKRHLSEGRTIYYLRAQRAV